MNRILLAAAPALVLAGLGSYAALNAQNAPAVPGQVDATRVLAGRYAVDSGHTLVGWRVNHFGFNDYFGIFGDVSGSLELDPARLEATRLEITIPISKVTTASAGLTDHLLRAGKDGGKPDFFGASPADARFVSTGVTRTGPNTATITGDLTLNGITKPVAIAAEFTGAGSHPMNKRLNIGFEGRAAIKRSDFGIGYGVPLVGDMVELDITAAFEQAPAQAVAEGAGDRCNAAAGSFAVGRTDNAALRAELAAKVGHARIRWLTPGTMATRDYRIDRLNVDIDTSGTVSRLRCG